MGLMQGEVVSPILFSLYINDFEMSFLNFNCPSYDCNSLSLFLLMYAEDLVIFSETIEVLQSQLDGVRLYIQIDGI